MAKRTVGQAYTTWHNVFEVGILFEKEQYTEEYSKYLQTGIAEGHKNVYNNLAWFKPYNTPPLQP
jgi:hypothetical protein